MPANRRLDPKPPDEVRRQLAVQLQVDNSHLEAIPADGLYRLREQLNVDELTGVLARRAGAAALDEAIVSVRLSGNPELTVAFLDVDGLKAVNDARGHATGDLMLMALGDVLRVTLRSEDIVFRYGGDEFVCAMPFTTVFDAEDMLLEAWRELSTTGGGTFSAGFAELRPGDTSGSLIARADECLYAGRRRLQRRDWRIAR